MSKTRIDVGKDFSPTPAGRFVSEGPYSGEAFRQKLLVPALREGGLVEIVLDTTDGYGSSFLEEAFGGLVRVHEFTAEDIKARISLITDDESLRAEILSYIRDAD